jgi:hypothetical protein
MKAVVIGLLLAAVVFVTGDNSVCTISGDPHYVTFDSVYHDYQGVGVFIIATNPYVTVQSQMLRCNVAAPYFTSCIRDLRLEIKAPGSGKPSDIVHFGTWWTTGTTGAVSDDPFIVNGATLPLPSGPYTTPNQGAKITYDATRKSWTVEWETPTSQYYPPGQAPAWSLKYAHAYIAISLPKSEGFLYSTYGLCGFFDNDGKNDFKNITDFTYLVSASGTRYNGGNVLPWGLEYGVAADGWWTPLGYHYHYWQPDGNGGFVTQASGDLPPLEQPDSTQQAALGTLAFKSVPWMAQVQAMCEQYEGDIKQYENCVYDGALMNDLTLAEANHLAAVAAQELVATEDAKKPQNTETVDNTGTVAGAACGAVGGVGLLAAGIFFFKFRKVKSDMSRALIVRDNQGATSQVQL